MYQLTLYYVSSQSALAATPKAFGLGEVCWTLAQRSSFLATLTARTARRGVAA